MTWPAAGFSSDGYFLASIYTARRVDPVSSVGVWRVVACVDPVLCGLGMGTNVQGPRVKRAVTSTKISLVTRVSIDEDGTVERRRVTSIPGEVRVRGCGDVRGSAIGPVGVV